MSPSTRAGVRASTIAVGTCYIVAPTDLPFFGAPGRWSDQPG